MISLRQGCETACKSRRLIRILHQRQQRQWQWNGSNCFRFQTTQQEGRGRSFHCTSATTRRAAATDAPSPPKTRLSTTAAAVLAIVATTVTTVAIVSSLQARTYRSEHINELPYANNDSKEWKQQYKRNIQDVARTVQRAGLMGSSKSVLHELDAIRKWHHDNGYKGGIVLRDLTRTPVLGWDLFDGDHHSDSQQEHTDLSIADIIDDPTSLARRECYYFYYELQGNGAIRQEIFCRGTTLFADILTCLDTKMVYDDDLECRVHKGFRNHADRILQDVLPLLAPRLDRRATIELAGHSLGGAVAAILAIKLGKRGYHVIRCTTVGEPRFCAQEADADRLLSLLPKDHLRVENDQDFVPFLPPFGSHIGNKLWLINNRSTRFVVAHEHEWTESVWLNFCVWELLSAYGKPHRVPYYVDQLLKKKETEPRTLQ